jgi:hypothetical protein
MLLYKKYITEVDSLEIESCKNYKYVSFFLFLKDCSNSTVLQLKYFKIKIVYLLSYGQPDDNDIWSKRVANMQPKCIVEF